MKRKNQILKFLEQNWTMIDSLMSDEERKAFGNRGVVGFIVDDIKKRLKKKARKSKCNT